MTQLILMLFLFPIHPIVNAATSTVQEAKVQYRCPMHPTVLSDHTGECPICHMTLEKVRVQGQPAAKNTAKDGRRIKFYRHPMNPSIHSDVPAKDDMGMDYIPVYEDENAPSGAQVEGRGSVSLAPEQLKLSGTSSVPARKEDLVHDLRVPGRVLSGGQIIFQVYEQDLAEVKAGLSFEAEAPSLPGERLSGRINSVESILDPMTRTARVNGTLTRAPTGGLRAESSVSGRIQVRKEQALVVPDSAVLHTGERDLVYVADGSGNFTPRAVRVGMRGQGKIEIRQGLKEGELVSAGPNFLIDSESRIQGSYDSSDH